MLTFENRAIFQKFCFLTHFMKNYAIVEISTKKMIIRDNGFELTKLIVLLIFRILRHNDVITIYIGHMSSDLRSGYRTSFVC